MTWIVQSGPTKPYDAEEADWHVCLYRRAQDGARFSDSILIQIASNGSIKEKSDAEVIVAAMVAGLNAGMKG